MSNTGRLVPAYRIQHIETGCWLLIERNLSWWLSFKEHGSATRFAPEHAVEVARELHLRRGDYRITDQINRCHSVGAP